MIPSGAARTPLLTGEIRVQITPLNLKIFLARTRRAVCVYRVVNHTFLRRELGRELCRKTLPSLTAFPQTCIASTKFPTKFPTKASTLADLVKQIRPAGKGRPDGAFQPGPGKRPVPVHRAGREVEGSGDIRDGHADEIDQRKQWIGRLRLARFNGVAQLRNVGHGRILWNPCARASFKVMTPKSLANSAVDRALGARFRLPPPQPWLLLIA